MVIILVLIGFCIGSFLSVIVSRLDRRDGILLGHSECPKCSRQLRWYDLIPIVSYLILKGHCRYCGRKISSLYPLVEFLTALFFLLLYMVNPSQMLYLVIFNLVIISILLSLAFFDYLYFIIPDKIILPAGAGVLIFDFFVRKSEFPSYLLTALVLSGFFAILYLMSRGRWVGLGDVKLLLLIGLVLGYPLALISLTLSIWIAAIVGLSLVTVGRATRKTALPFGAFLSIVTILIIIYQNEIQRITNQIF